MEEHVVRHIYEAQRAETRIKLIKNTRAYGWEISVSLEDSDQALEELRAVDEKLRKDYGGDSDKEK